MSSEQRYQFACVNVGSCLSPFRKAKLEVNVFRKVIMEKGNYVLGPEEQSVVTK